MPIPILFDNSFTIHTFVGIKILPFIIYHLTHNTNVILISKQLMCKCNGHCDLYSAALIDCNRRGEEVLEAARDFGSLSGEGLYHHLRGQTRTC